MKNFPLVHLYGDNEDEQILRKIKNYFPKNEVEGIVCPELLKLGGELNRLVWNITI